MWSADGSALVYLANPGAVPMVVEIEPGPGLVAAKPRPLSEDGIGAIRDRQGPAFDLAPDGKSLVLVGPERLGSPAVPEILVVYNWFEELNR